MYGEQRQDLRGPFLPGTVQLRIRMRAQMRAQASIFQFKTRITHRASRIKHRQHKKLI